MKRLMLWGVLSLVWTSNPLFAATVTIDFENVSSFYVVKGYRTKSQSISTTTDIRPGSTGSSAMNFTWYTDGAYAGQYAYAVVDLDRSYDFSQATLSFWHKKTNRGTNVGIALFHKEAGQSPVKLAEWDYGVASSWTAHSVNATGSGLDLTSVNAIGFMLMNTGNPGSGLTHTVYFDDFVATNVSLIPLPVITPSGGTYVDSASVTMSSPGGFPIYYTTDGSTTPDNTKSRYTSPLILTQTTTVKAVAYDLATGDYSAVNTVTYVVVPSFVDASTFGYDPQDATAALQNAINTHARFVYVPNMGTDWIVRPITLVSDQEIGFGPGVNVVAKRGEYTETTDCMFAGDVLTNVKLSGNNTTFRMWKEDYVAPPYTAGQWRHGIALRGCSNVTISGITITKTGGDGIYLGSRSVYPYMSNTVIKNVVCTDNHRQGISVISADNLTIENCVLRYTNGTAPMGGIDFESNYTYERLQNIVVKQCVFEGNFGPGLEFYTQNLPDPDNYSAVVKNCTFYANGATGMWTLWPSSQLVLQDNLFVNNTLYGVANSNAPSISTIYCGYWGNVSGAASSNVTLDTGCLTTVQPLFASTDWPNANYMFLASDCPAAITAGASDGGYMGARPVVGTVSPTPTPTPILIPTPTVVTPTPAPVPGDANLDGRVTFEDFSTLQNHYGQSVTGDTWLQGVYDGTWAQGDFDGDRKVTFADFSILQNHYGQIAGPGGTPAADTLGAASGLSCGSLAVVLGLLLGLGVLSVKGEN